MNKKAALLSFVIIALACGGSYFYVMTPKGEMKVSYEPAATECYHEKSAVPWSYCINTAKQGTNGSVAYLLHGRNKNENQWNDDSYYTAQLQKVWALAGIKPPKIVVISFGSFWLLTPKATAPKSGLLDIFIHEVIPEVEKHTGVPKARLLFGESMGGLNTLIAILREGQLFKRALSLCPPIYRESPFSSFAVIQDFLKRTGADPRTIYGVKALGPQYAANDEEWDNIAPLKLLEKADPSKIPPLYLSCGLYDRYGNYEAVESFVEMARARKFNLEWHPLYGGHCAVDIDSVSQFLARE